MTPVIIGGGSPRDPNALPLYTKKLSWIANEMRLPQPPARQTAARENLLRGVRSARVRSLSSTYNCIGMVFASRRTWVEPSATELILRDDGYSRVGRDADADVGDIVVYQKPTGEVVHAAVLVAVDPNLRTGSMLLGVLSQFGDDGEYFHDILDLPAALRDLEFRGRPTYSIWTDRT